MAAKPTPEEKLFAVIQGAAHPPLRRQPRTLSLAGVGSSWAAWAQGWDLPRVNDWLAAVAVLLGIACIASVFVHPDEQRLLAQAQQRRVPFSIQPPLEGLQPSERYLSVMQERNPFRLETPPAPSKLAFAVEPAPAPKDADPRAVLADLKLVGISLHPEPVAMIEQVSTRQTHVLHAGDVIGAATVKEVLPDRVILRIGEQDADIF